MGGREAPGGGVSCLVDGFVVMWHVPCSMFLHSIPPLTAGPVKACEGEGERISLSYCIIVLSPWLYLVFLVRGLSVPTVVHVYTGHKCLCSHTPPTSALSTEN